MIVNIEKSAVDYLKHKEKTTITVYIRKTSGGWCQRMIQLPELAYSAPSVQDRYIKFEQDGITVFVADAMQEMTAQVTIAHKKILLFNYVYVKNVDLPTL